MGADEVCCAVLWFFSVFFWFSVCVGETNKERDYFRREARALAQERAADPRKALADAEARLTIALHYKIPYPRPHNVPHRMTGAGERPVTRTPEH